MVAFEFDPPSSPISVDPLLGSFSFATGSPYIISLIKPVHSERRVTTLFDSELAKFQPVLDGNFVSFQFKIPAESTFLDIYISTNQAGTNSPLPPGATTVTWTEPFRIYMPSVYIGVRPEGYTEPPTTPPGPGK